MVSLDDQIIPAFLNYLHVDLKISRDSNSSSAIKCRLRKLFRWFGNKEYTKENARAFIGELLEANAKPNYMNKFVVLCKQLDAFLGTETMRGFSYFRETYKAKETLTPAEIQLMANIVLPYKKQADYVNQRQRCLVLLLGTTGCRIGEALNLQWGDLLSEPPHVIFRETKNGDIRYVPIGRELYNDLRSLPQVGKYIFSSYRGGILEHQEVNLDLKRRAVAVGITKPVYAHVFRHSYITTMLESGVDSLDVAHIVGHRDPKSTMRYKNSLLTYYSGVVQLHPILRSSLTVQQILEKTRALIKSLADPNMFDVYYEEGANAVSMKILKRN